MTFETIQFANDDGVARITLNRPERLNSFTVQMHEELAQALDAADADPEVRAIWLTGAGRGFCAGQDLNERTVTPGSAPADLGETIARHWAPLVRRLAMRDKPVVCAVNGVAAGAGANVALACDIVFAARSAKFIQSFANIGLIPDTGGTFALPRMLGQARALGLALTAEPLPAERAAEWGLIWKCVDDDALEAESLALAKRLAAGPTRGLAATKHALRASFQLGLGEALESEQGLMHDLGFSEDYGEGVRAFFEKRAPNFVGR